MSSAWYLLFLAGLFEVGWAIGLKYTEGFTRPLASILTIAGMLLSFFFLSKAVRVIPLGTGYAVWTGIGVAGTAIAGLLLFKEPMTLLRAFFFVLLIVGVIGLRFAAE